MVNDELLTRVLIIDDERDIRDGCERILSRMCSSVVTASSGEEGLQIVEKEDISIVLSDIKMPGIDGIEVLDRIRKYDDSILVIMITGFATVDTAIQAMKKGAYDFVSKPFTPDQLRIIVKRAIDKIRLTQEAIALKKERERNLADLNTEQSRIRTIIENLPNGVLVTNMYGNIVLINPVTCKYLGIDPKKPVGNKIETYIDDEGLCNYVMEISRGNYGQKDDIAPYELVCEDERYVLVQGRPVLGGDNECLGAVINLSDITTMKVFDRLKSEFVAKVSHELRSPLSTIHEQLAVVLKESSTVSSEDSQYMLGRAKEKTQGLIALIGDLLDLSRIEAGNVGQTPKKLAPGEIIERVVEFLVIQAKKKNQTLTMKRPDKPVSQIVADPTAIESIFGNLVTNAIKYTPEKGEIKVSIEEDEKIIRVVVQDNGYGIEKRHQDKIFTKFYRIKDDNTRFITGTGLGLPIVKNLVDNIGGEILLESEPDKGSTFTVTLPVS